MTGGEPLRVLIAGGGVAALEAALALRSLAGKLVAVELGSSSRPFTAGYDEAVVLFGWDVYTLPEALAWAAAGITALPLALHFVNALAALWARFSRALLPAPAAA